MHPAPDAALQENEPTLIDPAELPATDKMELNYLVEPLDPEAVDDYAKSLYFIICAIALIITAISYWFGHRFGTQEGMLSTLSFGFVSVWILKRWQKAAARKNPPILLHISTKELVVVFFAPFILGLCMALSRSLSQSLFIFMILAIAGLLYLIHQVFSHIINMINVHPDCEWSSALKKVNSNTSLLVALTVFSITFFYIIFIGLLVFFDLGPSHRFSGENPGTMTFINLMIITWIIILLSMKIEGVSIKDLWKTTNIFISSWIASLRGEFTNFPGVYRPVKSAFARWAITAGVFCLISLTVLPATAYFPLGYEIGPRAYLEDTYITMRNDGGFTELRMMSLSVPASRLMGVNIYPPQSLRYPADDVNKELYDEQVSEWHKTELKKFFREVPFGSVLYFLDLAFAKNALFIFPAIITLAVCFLTPFAVFFTAFCFGSTVGIGKKVSSIKETNLVKPPALDPDTWNEYVKRLQRSKDELERKHLFIGTHHPSDIPILLDRTVLEGHAYISGDSGSGKTALGITPMLTQLIRSTSRSYEAKRTDASFVILDLKGDSALFNTVKEEAKAAGLPFRWFTSEAGHSSYVFNPLAQRAFDELSEIAMTELQMAALSLEHGEGYGKSYFSRRARNWLYRVMRGESFEKGGSKDKRPRSFKELKDIALNFERLNEKNRNQEIEHTYEILSVVKTLAAFPQLNESGPGVDQGATDMSDVIDSPQNESGPGVDQGAIDMSDVIDSPQVVYFWLPASISSASVREIGKLALYSLLAAAYQRSRSDKPRMNTYCFIDEFQRIAAENFRIILQQARSMKIPMILSNQTPTDLREGANDFFPTVQGNTRLWHSFAAGDIYHQDLLVNSSGEVLRLMQGLSEGMGNISRSTQQIIRPRISKNHLLEMTDDEKSGVFHLKRGAGYSRYRGFPMVVKSTYSMSLEEYQRREKCPWPEGNEQTVTAKIKSSKIDTPST